MAEDAVALSGNRLFVASFAYMARTDSTGATILVVDDELLLRLHTTDVLADDGYASEHASSADEAMGLLQAHGYAAVVTDIQMPGELNGLDLAWAVEAHWPDVGVVITSGTYLPYPEEIPPRARFVAKPWRDETLLQAVREVITS